MLRDLLTPQAARHDPAACILYGDVPHRELEVGLLKGKLADPVRADKTIATDDVGAFAALAFERPKDFIGPELEIAGRRQEVPH